MSLRVHIPKAPATRHYPSLGRCLYCDAEFPQSELTNEHIIPYGLSGTLIFDNASCRECAIAINKFETPCLQNMFLEPRLHLNLQSRRERRKQPTPLPRIAGHDASTDKLLGYEHIPLSEHPFTLTMPIFSAPAILHQDTPSDKFSCIGVSSYVSTEGRARLETQFALGRRAFTPFRCDHLFRLLAKIAHGTALAEIGPNKFEAFLPAIISGESPYQPHYIGNCLGSPPASEHLHEITLSQIGDLLAVDVRLFACLGAPSYLVIAGRSRSHLLVSAKTL